MKKPGRRQALQLGATLGGTLLARAQQPQEEPPEARTLGKPLSGYRERSAFVKSARATRQSQTPEAGSSSTPLAETHGIITPSSLHYERHHGGVPAIDPGEHRLTIHGLVDRPLVLTMVLLRSRASR